MLFFNIILLLFKKKIGILFKQSMLYLLGCDPVYHSKYTRLQSQVFIYNYNLYCSFWIYAYLYFGIMKMECIIIVISNS